MWSRDNDVLSLNDRREKERKMYIYYILYIYICRRIAVTYKDAFRRDCALQLAASSSNAVEKKGREGKGKEIRRRGG